MFKQFSHACFCQYTAMHVQVINTYIELEKIKVTVDEFDTAYFDFMYSVQCKVIFKKDLS